MRYLKFICLAGLLWACTDEEDNLPSVEERSEEAIEELREELTEPTNGWKLEYSPTGGSGVFFMLLNFDDDGTVNIKSDVVDNDGEFVNQTIPYRIDNALGLELIFETYGVFHYLFELEQAQFGAEFEFLFVEKDDGKLIFSSKTDFTDVTVLEFELASPSDDNLFSLEEAENLNVFDGLTPQIFGGAPPLQQLVFNDLNKSLFWSIDLTRRVIDFDLVGTGTTIEEINANADNLLLNHTTGYAFFDGSLVLLDPITFTHNGDEVTIAEVSLSDFSMTGDSFCSLTADNTPVYEASIPGVGAVTILKSLFNSSGTDFQPMTDQPYSVNVLFVFDEEANSLFEEGIIGEKFPNATGFVFNYGYDSDEQPAYAVGFFIEDANGENQTYLREFDPTTTEGNKIEVNLTNNFYYSDTPGVDDEQSLTEITDLIFEGGEMYIYNYPVSGATVFRLFNPCNRHEAFLVQ